MKVLCSIDDLQTTGARGFSLGEGEWPLHGLVVQLEDGGIRAWVNRCPHAGHQLNLQAHRFLTADRRWLRCSSHGAHFDPDSGLCVAGPCVGKSLQPVKILVEDDSVKGEWR